MWRTFNHHRFVSFGVFSLLLSVLFSFCFYSNSFAIEDLTYTINSNTLTTIERFTFCDNNNSSVPNCSDYNYIFINMSVLSPSLSGFQLNFDNYGLYFRTIFGDVVFSSVSNFSSISSQSSSSWLGSSTFTITFSENNPFSSGPSGNIDITENGTYDVTNYASATVNVENEIIQGDYHDDLVSINNSILIVAAVGLVIYFFYAIYKMLLGGRK